MSLTGTGTLHECWISYHNWIQLDLFSKLKLVNSEWPKNTELGISVYASNVVLFEFKEIRKFENRRENIGVAVVMTELMTNMWCTNLFLRVGEIWGPHSEGRDVDLLSLTGVTKI